MQSQSVTLEQFAKLTAKIDAGEPVAKVLSESDLDAEQWASVQRTWLTRMAERAARGKPSLHQRFVGLLDEHRREVEVARRAEKQLEGPLPEPPEERKAPVLVRRRPVAPTPAAAPLPRPAPPRRGSAPSMPAVPPRPSPVVPDPPPQASPPQASPSPQRPDTAAMRAMPDLRPRDAALPFGDQRSVLPFPGSPPARSAATPKKDEPHVLPFRSTGPAPPTETSKPSPLPFRAAAEPKPPPPTDLGPEPRSLGSTMAMSSEDFAAARAALLPFLEAQKKAADEASASPERDLGSTAYISPEDMAKARAALPFGAPPASVDTVPGETAEIPPDSMDSSAVTAEIPPGAPKGVPVDTAEMPPEPSARSALPFQSSPEPAPTGGQPTLSLEQYAWLCATLERSSAKLEETLAWLRMSAAQKAELDAAWRAAMARDSALAARFEALRQSYLAQG